MARQSSSNVTHDSHTAAGLSFAARMSSNAPGGPNEGGVQPLHGPGRPRSGRNTTLLGGPHGPNHSWYLDLLSEQGNVPGEPSTGSTYRHQNTHTPSASSLVPSGSDAAPYQVPTTSSLDTGRLGAPVMRAARAQMVPPYGSEASMSSTRAQVGPPVSSEGGTAGGVVGNKSAAEGPEASTGGQKRI